MTSGAAVERVAAGRGDDPAGAGPSAAALAAQAALEARRAALGIAPRHPAEGLDGAPVGGQGQAAASRARRSALDRAQGALEAARLERGINYRRPTAEGRAWSALAAERAGGPAERVAVPAGGLDGAALGRGAAVAGAGQVGAQTPHHAAASTGRPLPLLALAGAGDDLDGPSSAAALLPDDQGDGGRVEGERVKVHPRIAAAMLRTGHAAAGRLWLLLPASDPARRGAHDLDHVFDSFAGTGATLRVGGRRRVQQLLREGAGIFWTRDKRGRLWRHGPARVAAALGLVGGVGAPVLVPVSDLLGGMRSTRAGLFSAALSGHDDPICQAILAELTGACPNSQRAYRATAGVAAYPQYRFLEGAADGPALQEAHWQHGRGVFVFVDHDGRLGRGRGARMLAKRDPNAYAAALEPARRGRTRKINRRLNLVTNGARGNGPAVDYERFYFQDAGAAGSAYNRARGRHDVAYRLDTEAAGGVGFWGTIPALQGARG